MTEIELECDKTLVLCEEFFFKPLSICTREWHSLKAPESFKEWALTAFKIMAFLAATPLIFWSTVLALLCKGARDLMGRVSQPSFNPSRHEAPSEPINVPKD